MAEQLPETVLWVPNGHYGFDPATGRVAYREVVDSTVVGSERHGYAQDWYEEPTQRYIGPGRDTNPVEDEPLRQPVERAITPYVPGRNEYTATTGCEISKSKANVVRRLATAAGLMAIVLGPQAAIRNAADSDVPYVTSVVQDARTGVGNVLGVTAKFINLVKVLVP